MPDTFLNKSEFKIFFEKNPQPLFLYDAKTFKIYDVNNAALKFYQYSKKEFLSFTLYDIRPVEEVNNFKNFVKSIKNNRESQEGKVPGYMIHKKKDGTQVKVEVFRNEIIYNGKECKLALIIDITDKLINEEKFKKLSEATTEGVSIIENGIIIDVNDAFAKIFGYKKTECIGKSVLHFTAEESRDYLINKVKSGYDKPYQAYGITKKGNKILCELKPNVIDYFGKKVRVTCVRDITKETLIEEKLNETLNNYKLITNTASDIIFQITLFPKYTYNFISPSVKEVLGYSQRDFYKNPLLAMQTIHPDDRHLTNIDAEKVFKYGPQKIVLRSKHKNGHYIWTETINNPIYNREGKLVGITGVSRDISKSKHEEMRLDILSNLTNEAVIISSNGKLKDANNIALKIVGVENLAEVQNKNILDFVHSADKALVRKNLNKENKNPIVFKIIDLKGIEKTLESTSKYVIINGQKQRVSVFRDISDQIDIAYKLKENERFLNSVVNNLQGVIYRCKNDKNWTMIFISNSVYDLTGYTSEEFLSGKINFGELIYSETKTSCWNKVQKAIKNKEQYQFVYQIKHKSGHSVWIWEQGKPIYEKNKFIALEGYIVNINEQKQAENELIKSKTAFKELVDNSPDGIMIHHNGILEYVNDSVLKIAEIKSVKNIIGKNVLDFVSAPYKTEVAKRIGKASKGDKLPFFEFDMLLPNGKLKRIETKATPIFFNDKHCVQVIVHDLTQKILVERERLRAQLAEETNKVLFKEIEERKRVEKKLIETQMFSTNLIESSLDVIMASDNEGIITEINKAATDVFGFLPAELLGKKADILFSDTYKQKEIETRLLSNGFFKGEVVNKHKSGRLFISYLSASVIKNEAGEIIGTMGVSRDITEQKRAETLLKQSEENYRSLFNKAYIGFVKLSITGKILDANERFCSMFGLSNNEFKNKFFKELIATDEYEHALDIRRVLLKGSNNNYADELICLHSNGTEVITNITCSVSKGHNNVADYFIVLLEDITQRKKNEEKVFLQAAKLNAVFESSSHIIWTVNRNNTLTSFNSNFAETIFKFFNKIIDPFKTKLNDLFLSDTAQLNKWSEAYNEAFKGNIQQIEFYITDLKGEIYWYEIFLYPIFSLKLEVFEVSGLGNNITDRKKAEQKIADQAAKLNSIIESSSHLIFTLNTDLIFTSCNENYRKTVLDFQGIMIEIGKTSLTKVLSKDGAGYKSWQEALIDAFSGKRVNFEFKQEAVNGKIFWRDVYIQPIINESGEIEEVSVIAHDITEKKIAIENSLLQAAHIKAIFQNSTLLIYTIDKNYVLQSFNHNYRQFILDFYGYETQVGKDLKKGFNALNNAERYNTFYNYHLEALNGRSLSYEYRIADVKGNYFWFEHNLDPIVLPDGSIEGVTYITRDITEKKEAEQKLIDSAREKEVLLKEVHHRVKNNLQVISSILSLQSTYTKDPSVLAIIRESQNRIKSMSFIHETLYQTKNFSDINFSVYVKNIVTNLVHTYQLVENKVIINFELDEVVLSLDASIPCGLIFNELISNALKYAFVGRERGILTIGLRQKANNVTLYVKDNGIGFPENVDIFNTESLGLQLVSALTEQLDGKLECKNENGTNFIITFINKLKSIN